MNSINQAVAKTISDLRLKASLSQEELADAANIHRTYVSQIERGLKSPTLLVLVKLAAALKMKPSAVMSLIEENLDALQNK